MNVELNDRQQAVLQFVSMFEEPLRLSDIYQLEDYELFEYQRQIRAAVTFLEKNSLITSKLQDENAKVKFYSISAVGKELLENLTTIELNEKIDICATLNNAFKFACCTTRSYNTSSSTKAAI